jgi:hypothetical protein
MVDEVYMVRKMTKTHLGLYSTASNKEIDLREELSRTLLGASDEIAKGRHGIFRKMRRDSEGIPQRCPCRDTLTDEPDEDYYCRYCLSHGFLWDEHEIVYHKNEEHLHRTGEAVFYFEFDEAITDIDFIVEVELNSEGKPVNPVNRARYYRVDKASPFRADNARLEFWRVIAVEDRPWSVWYGINLRTRDDGS